MRSIFPIALFLLVAVLMLVGLFVQLGANLGMQWAFGVVGLAVSVPVMFGAMNVVGGYVVTDRMLQMFRKKPTAPKAGGTEA